jgi:hypothetical protein
VRGDGGSRIPPGAPGGRSSWRTGGDRAVVVWLSLRAEEGGEEKYVWQADGVVLQTAPEGGDVVRRGAQEGEELLKAGGQAGLLLGRDGEGMAEGVHDDARVGDALRGLLPLLVAESQAQGMCEPMPIVLGAGAYQTSTVETLARGLGRGLGGEDGVVDPHNGVEGLGVEATLSRRVGRVRETPRLRPGRRRRPAAG